MSDMTLDNLEPALLHPTPGPIRGTQCDFCNKPQSSFWYGSGGPEPKIYVCSICVLYDSQWGKHFHAQIVETSSSIEKSRNKEFAKGEGSRLLDPKDADDVLGLIVLTGRVAMVSRMGSV